MKSPEELCLRFDAIWVNNDLDGYFVANPGVTRRLICRVNTNRKIFHERRANIHKVTLLRGTVLWNGKASPYRFAVYEYGEPREGPAVLEHAFIDEYSQMLDDRTLRNAIAKQQEIEVGNLGTGTGPRPWAPSDVERKAYGKQDVGTPPNILETIRLRYGDFLDPCPIKPEFDGLRIDWSPLNYVNPPYASVYVWVIKAIAEAAKGNRSIFLVPAISSSYWFARAANSGFLRRVHFIRGYVAFAGHSNPLPLTMCFLFFGPFEHPNRTIATFGEAVDV